MAYTSKNFKKFTVVGATAAMVASAVVPAAAADVNVKNFTDVSKNYTAAVTYLVENGLSNGLTSSKYGIDTEVKRGDAAIILAKALGLQSKTAPASGFTDVPDRAALSINALKEAGIVKGKTATKFGFTDTLKRGEVALMLANAKAYDLKGKIADVKFTDVNDRYKEAVAGMVANGITQGTSATKFGTDNPIKRGDFAIFVYKAETLTVEDASFVSAVDAISKTGVTVTLAKDVEAQTDATVEVKDPAGKVVAVKAVSFEKGTKTATFEFVTPLTEVVLGEWTVDSVKFDTGIPAAIAAVNAATDELKLAAALEAKYFSNVDVDLIKVYFTEMSATDFTSIKDIQTVVDKVNADTDKSEREALAVKAVNDAKTQVQLKTALQNSLFARVNADWISAYETALAGNQTTVVEIQTALDGVNTAEVKTAYDKALTGLVAADITKAAALVEAYIAADIKDSELTPKQDMLDALKVQSALVTLNAATTNGSVTTALNGLATATEDFTKAAVNPALASAYKEALSGKNLATVDAVNAAVKAVNTAAEATAVKAIDAVTATTTTAQLKALFTTLADRSSFASEDFTMDAVNDKFLADYLKAFVAATPATAADVMNIITDVNKPTAELAAIEAATAETLYAALNSVQFNFSNLVEANKEAYIADLTAFKFFADATSTDSVAAVRNLITAVNAKEAVESATTAVEVRDALQQAADASIDLGVGTAGAAYINLGAEGRLEVAALVLAADDTYATVESLQTALAEAISERTALIAGVNSAAQITAMDKALEALSNSSYDAMTPAAQLLVAEKVLNAKPEGGFKSITQIVAAF